MGKGNFIPLSIQQSGIYIPDDGKSLTELKTAAAGYLLVASQNRGPLKVYAVKKKKTAK